MMKTKMICNMMIKVDEEVLTVEDEDDEN